MPSLTATDIADLVAGTLRDLGPPKFSQVAQNLTRYHVFTKWMKKGNVEMVDSGYGVQRNIMARLANNFRHVSWNDEDNITIADIMEQLQVNFVYATGGYGFHYYELLMNQGEYLVFNLLEPRRASAMIEIAEGLEQKFWEAPAVGDAKSPYGIPYWVVTNATEGFNGSYPGSHTTLAGIDLNDAPNFKNYTGQYTSISKNSGGLIKFMRNGARKCDFVSPVTINDYRTGSGQQFNWYTNADVLQGLEDVGEAQNENLGRDLARMDGQMVFHSLPIIYIPQLDSDTTDPMYGIDHQTWKVFALKGAFLRESDVIRDPRNHNKYFVPVDLAYNTYCTDRRRNMVFYA